MHPWAGRGLADCCSPQSQLCFLSPSFSPWCAVRKNLKTWLPRIREDTMTTHVETSATSEYKVSDTNQPKQVSHSKGKRLLWFLVIPVLLACSAFLTVHARRKSNASLAATTKTIALQNVSVI